VQEETGPVVAAGLCHCYLLACHWLRHCGIVAAGVVACMRHCEQGFMERAVLRLISVSWYLWGHWGHPPHCLLQEHCALQ
jgi:hypothetical protein